MTWRDLLSDAELAHAEQVFLNALPPDQHAAVQHIGQLRAQDFAYIEEGHHTYLDYTGGSLSPTQILDSYKDQLQHSVLGNPHSRNPTSAESTYLSNRARRTVLEYFGVPCHGSDPNDFDAYDYTCVFTSNASHSLRLVGEAFPFRPGGVVGILRDNHNSAVAIREYARAYGAQVEYLNLTKPDLQIDEVHLEAFLSKHESQRPSLVVLPAQSNFTGVRHPARFISAIQNRGFDVLLDAAASAPTTRLNLSEHKPAFAVAAFYKMFGFPTGIGVLFIRKDKMAQLRRPSFAGGSVEFVSSLVDHAFSLIPGHASFEDGTPNYLGLQGITLGVEYLQLNGSAVHLNVRALTDWTLAQLDNLHLPDGRPLITRYGRAEGDAQGGTITLNIASADPDALPAYVPYQKVESDAAQYMISLRAGRFCNHVVAEQAFGIPVSFMEQIVAKYQACTNKVLVAEAAGKPFSIGAVRFSFGLASTFRDAYVLVAFLRRYLHG